MDVTGNREEVIVINRVYFVIFNLYAMHDALEDNDRFFYFFKSDCAV